MTNRLPPHTLMVTFLHDRLNKRQLSLPDLVELLEPISEKRIQDWFKGHASPEPSELVSLAEALHVSPVELTCGWLIDRLPIFERHIREITLDPMASRFPRSADLDLRAPAPSRNMTVEDLFDDDLIEGPAPIAEHGRVLRVAAGRQKPPES